MATESASLGQHVISVNAAKQQKARAADDRAAIKTAASKINKERFRVVVIIGNAKISIIP